MHKPGKESSLARGAAGSANRCLSQVVRVACVSALSSCVASAIMYSRENTTTRGRLTLYLRPRSVFLTRCWISVFLFIVLSAPHSFIVAYSVSSLITIDFVFITFITQILLSSYYELSPKRPNYFSIYSAVIKRVRYWCVHIQGVNILGVRDIGPYLNVKRASAQ